MRIENLRKQLQVVKLTDDMIKLISDFSIPSGKVAEMTGLKVKSVYRYRYKIRLGPNNEYKSSRKESKDNYINKYNVKYGGRRRWTIEEDRFIMTSDLPDKDISNILHRSIRAIVVHRGKLRKALNQPFNETNTVPYLDLMNSRDKSKNAKEFIINHYTEMTVRELSEVLGISRGSVANILCHLRQEGKITGSAKRDKIIPRKQLNIINNHYDILEKYMNKEIKCQEAADLLGVNLSTFFRALNKVKENLNE